MGGMRRLPIVIGLLAACSYSKSQLGHDAQTGGDDGPSIDMPQNITPDASIDAMADAAIDGPSIGTNCYGPSSGAFRICIVAAPTSGYAVNGGAVNYNTTTCTGGSVVAPSPGPDLCVIAATGISIDSTFS